MREPKIFALVARGNRCDCDALFGKAGKSSQNPSRFRNIVDLGRTLLQCSGSELPDMVVAGQLYDDWLHQRFEECLLARRELVAVPIVVLRLAPNALYPLSKTRLTVYDGQHLEHNQVVYDVVEWLATLPGFPRSPAPQKSIPNLEHIHLQKSG